MRGRGKKNPLTTLRSGEPVAERQALERRWHERLDRDPRLALLVSSEGAPREPFHRWLRYRQGFSPGLVRYFLKERGHARRRSGGYEVFESREARPDLPLLDPFSGSGTFVTECARMGLAARGVEALPSLVFLANAKTARSFPALPDLAGATHWQDFAARLDEPVHRAALMLAIARQHTTAGRLNRGARPLAVEFALTGDMMREDLLYPLPYVNEVEVGDARNVATVADASIDGILSSPPYLSRHDYTTITAPFETVYQYWYGEEDAACRATVQLPASGRTRRPMDDHVATYALPPAAAEVCAWLREIRQAKLADIVARYFADMRQVLAECRRVLVDGAACWMVVGGARLKDIYIPSDLIIAELSGDIGFAVENARVARDVIDARRKFAGIGHVAPRETLLVLRKL